MVENHTNVSTLHLKIILYTDCSYFITFIYVIVCTMLLYPYLSFLYTEFKNVVAIFYPLERVDE